MKKENNRHEFGKGNGKFGKKAKRISREEERPMRSMEERVKKAGAKERKKLGV